MKLIENFSVRGLFADFYRDSKNLLKIFFFVSKHVCINFTFAAWAGSHDDGQIFNEYCKSFMGQLCTNVLTRNPTADFYRDSKNLLKIFFFVSKHVCINFTFAAWAGSHDDGQIFNEYCKSFMGQLCTNVLTRNP